MHMMQRWMQQTNNSHDKNPETLEGIWSSGLGASQWTTPSSSWRASRWWRRPTVMLSPCGRVLEQGPDWFLVATEAYGGGTPDLLFSWMFSGYMEIYRRKKSVRGATRGPRGWRARPCLVFSSLIPWRALQVSRIAFLPKITFLKVSFRLDSVWYSFSVKHWNKGKTETGTGLWVNRLVPKII